MEAAGDGYLDLPAFENRCMVANLAVLRLLSSSAAVVALSS